MESYIVVNMGKIDDGVLKKIKEYPEQGNLDIKAKSALIRVLTDNIYYYKGDVIKFEFDKIYNVIVVYVMDVTAESLVNWAVTDKLADYYITQARSYLINVSDKMLFEYSQMIGIYDRVKIMIESLFNYSDL